MAHTAIVAIALASLMTAIRSCTLTHEMSKAVTRGQGTQGREGYNASSEKGMRVQVK